MINKVAEMTRLAEVRGCMAAFHDAGLIKCASEDAFDSFCEQVADQIGYDYDLQKIAGVADKLISMGNKAKRYITGKGNYAPEYNGVLDRIGGAFRGDKVKAGKELLSKVNKDALPHSLLGRRAANQEAAAKKLIRQGRIEQALAYGGVGAAGAAGAGGVAYGTGVLDN